MNVYLRAALLGTAYLIVLLGTLLWAAATPSPWAVVIGAGGLAILVWLLRLIWRSPRPVKSVPARGEKPDPWVPVVAAIHQRPDAELIALRDTAVRNANASSPVLLGSVVIAAVEETLRRRGIPLCPCGAPLPGGVHANTCQES